MTVTTIAVVLFFIGAVAAHIRARVFCNVAFPGSFLVLAVASLALNITASGLARVWYQPAETNQKPPRYRSSAA